MKRVAFGTSVVALALAVIYLRMESFFSPHYFGGNGSSVFTNILHSFYPTLDTLPIALKRDFGLVSTRSFSEKQWILSLPLDTFSSLVIDGDRNVPAHIASLPDFLSLSHNARIALCIAVHKMSDDKASPFSMLWKGAGVGPIPDLRWIKYRGIFSLGVNLTGIDEVDRYIAEAHSVVDESLKFAQKHNLAIPEQELQWSWVFLNAFGLRIGRGDRSRRVFVAPLVFARKTAWPTKGTELVLADPSTPSSTSAELKLYAVTRRKIERNEEILVDGSEFVSDGFAFLFHGSWVADESLHRARVFLPLPQSGSQVHQRALLNEGCISTSSSMETHVWLSNDLAELSASREKTRKCICMSILSEQELLAPTVGEEVWWPNRQLRCVKRIALSFKHLIEKFGPITTASPSSLDAVRFQYFNLMYNELLYWERAVVDLTSDQT